MTSSLARDLRTLPNLITLSRIGLLFVGGGLYFAGHQGIGIALAIVAGVTDYVDGMVARATGTVTRLGEILDQFCDVCYESTVLMVAIKAGFFPAWMMLVYLSREFWVMGIRRYAAGIGGNIDSNLVGKLKTNFLMWGFLPTFLSITGAWPATEPWMARFGHAAVAAGLCLGWVSALMYTRSFVAIYGRGAGSNTGERR
jgi:CDP-diacylglycerol--glycerol-3-phosphate 3-phosphatidyltransferase